MVGRPILTGLSLLRHFGLRWVLFRSWSAWKQRRGWLQRQFPPSSWETHPFAAALSDAYLAESTMYLHYRRATSSSFLFSPKQRPQFVRFFASWDASGVTPLAEATRLRHGEMRYFAHALVQVGCPPDWHVQPLTGQRLPADCHWSRIGDFDYGDIKFVWEPSRFSFVYPLVRAYWRTGDEQYAELFWQLVESWRAQNPPQQGPNWKCGQEISLRVMAWCFGLFGFLDSPRTTAERVTRLAHMIAVSGQRIEANLNYALSQRNNHGISEGMGLWTIGVLFPELRLAAKWRRLGRQVLATQGQELIYDDGAFAQHSVNYQRLMLHDYLWALRLGELYGQPFSAALKERIGKAGVFLYHIQDETSGRVPCYGQNDGALILPLNNCDFHDFRPVVQAIHYLTTGTRCYAAGPWDEDLLWLFGPRALTAPVQAQERGNFRADQGGYYVLRSCSSFAFTRCATFRHRPGQADMLHVDLWWRGQNVALDAGTYSYNAPEPWNNSFSHTAYHNTVIVDSRDQMERVGPFLWLPWLRGWLNRCQEAPGRHLAYWEGEHNGYARLKPPVRYRRGIVRLGHESWLILDALSSSGAHQYRLPWLLPDLPYTWDEAAGYLVLHTPVGPYHTRLATLSGSGTYSLMQADAHSPRGWRAPYYGCREPALSIELIDHAPETLFWTLFGPTPWQVTVEEDTLRIDANLWHAVINLQGDTKKPVIASASIIGTFNDRLELT